MGYLDEQSTCKDDQAHVVLTALKQSCRHRFHRSMITSTISKSKHGAATVSMFVCIPKLGLHTDYLVMV